MPEHYNHGGVRLLHGDCLDVLRTLPDASVHAVVTDPPYGLEFMGKDWDSFGGDRRQQHRGEIDRPDNQFGRAGIRYGVGGSYGGDSGRAMRAFQDWVEQWAVECLRVLKPGGHLLAFGGSRTWHRLAGGIEDAGFEIRDSIAWLYGSGFPKSLDVAKALDKTGGASPEVQARTLKAARERAGLTRSQVAGMVGSSVASIANWEDGRARAKGKHVEFITPGPQYRDALADLLGYSSDERAIIGASDDRRGDGTVMGLGHSGKKYGDATTEQAQQWAGWGTALKPSFEPIVVARKPLAGTVAANVLEHGTGALNIDANRVGDGSESQGARPSTEASASRSYAASGAVDLAAKPGPRGGAENGRWPSNVLLDEDQAAALDAASGMLTSGKMLAGQARKPKVGGVLGDFDHEPARSDTYGDSGGASRFFPVFRWQAKAPSSERPDVGGVQHPTVKPLALMQWLVRLVTPPGGTVLEPFAGSGTTLEACIREGFNVIGIEREADYLPLIMSRIRKDHAQSLFDVFEDTA